MSTCRTIVKILVHGITITMNGSIFKRVFAYEVWPLYRRFGPAVNFTEKIAFSHFLNPSHGGVHLKKEKKSALVF